MHMPCPTLPSLALLCLVLPKFDLPLVVGLGGPEHGNLARLTW